MKINRKFACLLYAFLIYVLSYSILSLNGCYEPGAVGIINVKMYKWAPFGFYNRGATQDRHLGWNSFMCYTFLPLWAIDITFVHPNY